MIDPRAPQRYDPIRPDGLSELAAPAHRWRAGVFCRPGAPRNDRGPSLLSMGCRSLGHPIETSMPAANLTAMTPVRWPITQEASPA